MKTPRYLKPGDAICMVAPSFGVTTDPYKTRYEAAVKNLKRQGYRIIEGPNVHLAEGVVASNTAELRAKEIMDAFSSDAALILSVGGGELMNEILPYIDFEKLRGLEPKWFMGFSDNTNLTYTLTTICGFQTIYGPCAPSFYEKPIRLNQLDSLRMLKGETTFAGYPKWHKPNFKKKIEENPIAPDPLRRCRYMSKKIINEYKYFGPFSGMILGGCLDCLQGIVGTKFDKTKEFISSQEEGVVWYLEACDLNPLSIRRALQQLKQAGWFDTAKGFLIGRPYCWDAEIFGVNRFNAVTDILEDLNVPILLDIDLGHHAPSLPFKNGGVAEISLKEGNIELIYNN